MSWKQYNQPKSAFSIFVLLIIVLAAISCSATQSSTIAPPLPLHDRGLPAYAHVANEDLANLLLNLEVAGEIDAPTLFVKLVTVYGETGSAQMESCEAAVTLYVIVSEFDIGAPVKAWQLPELVRPEIDDLTIENDWPVITMHYTSPGNENPIVSHLRIEVGMNGLDITESKPATIN